MHVMAPCFFGNLIVGLHWQRKRPSIGEILWCVTVGSNTIPMSIGGNSADIRKALEKRWLSKKHSGSLSTDRLPFSDSLDISDAPPQPKTTRERLDDKIKRRTSRPVYQGRSRAQLERRRKRYASAQAISAGSGSEDSVCRPATDRELRRRAVRVEQNNSSGAESAVSPSSPHSVECLPSATAVSGVGCSEQVHPTRATPRHRRGGGGRGVGGGQRADGKANRASNTTTRTPQTQHDLQQSDQLDTTSRHPSSSPDSGPQLHETDPSARTATCFESGPAGSPSTTCEADDLRQILGAAGLSELEGPLRAEELFDLGLLRAMALEEGEALRQALGAVGVRTIGARERLVRALRS